MAAEVYEPDETWPTPNPKHWVKALAVAHDAGWTLTCLPTGHWWGHVACPAGEHTGTVDRTARGGETKALELIKDVRGCQHGSQSVTSKVPRRQAECARLLDVAEELLSGAECGLEAAETRQGAYDRLDMLADLEDQLDSADLTIEAVFGRSAAAEREDALTAAIERDGAPNPDEIGESIGQAADAVDDAVTVASKIRREGLRAPLTARAEAAKGSILVLRDRLGRLQERL